MLVTGLNMDLGKKMVFFLKLEHKVIAGLYWQCVFRGGEQVKIELFLPNMRRGSCKGPRRLDGLAQPHVA